MLLLLGVAGGIILALSIWRVPAIMRRRTATKFFMSLSMGDAATEAIRPNVYTSEQRALLLNLALAKTDTEKRKLVSQLVSSFPDKWG
jgi:hypothetical protein